ESINLAIQGLLQTPLSTGRGAGGEGKTPLSTGRGAGGEGKHRIGLMPLEHKAVLDTCRALEKRGWAELVDLQVDSKGRLDLEHLEKVCAEGLSLLCVMAANNEIGTIYPIQKIGQIAQRHGIPFLCDGSQAVGKIPIQFAEWGITYLAISAHKVYGPKGVGALAVRRGHHLEPLIFGGGHQRGLRPGTLNVPGIVGLGEACRLRSLEMEIDEQAIATKRDQLQTRLLATIPGLIINGDLDHRLAGNLHISIPGIPNSAVIARLRHQLAISTGSACTSGIEAPSHVLQAIALPSDRIDSALRIGLGKFTTDTDIHQAATLLATTIQAIRDRLSP
ncbi:MAG TPA: cysteine desulfurase family protein, partial [Chroococcidiopsis sp.]